MKTYQKRLFFVSLAALFVVSGFFIANVTLAITMGPNNAGTGTDTTGIGTIIWSSPGNIAAADNLFATASISNGDVSHYLRGTNYGFSIPSSATINGIEVTINRSSSTASSIKDNVVSLVRGGVVVGANKAVDTSWSNSTVSANYGSTSDLWATTWTPADINASNFGVVLSVATNSSSSSHHTASVDYMQITVTYTPITTLTVNKICVPSNDTGKFNLRIDGTIDGTDVACGGTTGAVIVTTGSHTASETAGTGTNLSDYTSLISGDCNANGTTKTALVVGDNKVCTITNTKKGHLIVQKTTIPANDLTVFSITATGDGTITGGGGGTITDAIDKNYEVTSGTYTVNEAAPSGWERTSNDCSNVTVVAGATATCNFTNTKLGEIHGIKFNDLNGNGFYDGEEPGMEGVTIELTSQNHAKRTTTTNEDGLYSFFDVFPDVYTVSEVSQQGWTQMSTSPAPITINPGDVVNNINFGNFHEVTITVLKWEDTNGNGQKDQGEPAVKDVPVEVRRVLDGHFPVQNPLIDTELVALSLTSVTGQINLHVPTPGNHIIMEKPQDGWQKTYPVQSFFDVFVETSGSTINMGTPHSDCHPTTLVPVCPPITPVPLTFGNFKLITVTVQKDVVAPDGESNTRDSHTFKVKFDNGDENNFSENGSKEYQNVGPGSHTIAEIGDPDFDLLRIVAGDTILSDGQFIPQSGQNMTVTVTNKQKKGSLIVKKIVTNPNGGTTTANQFSFTLNRGEPIPFNQDGENPLMGENDLLVDPGSYLVTEPVIPNGAYAISYQNCEITIASNGQSSSSGTCTITNSDIPKEKGAITVIKDISQFDNSGTLGISDFSLFITPEEDDQFQVTSGQAQFLEPGNYTISEGEVPEGYTKRSISCTNGQTTTTGSVALVQQQSWVCTIINDDEPAHLMIVKNTGNENYNGAFEFTVTGITPNPSIITTAGGGQTSPISLNKGSYNVVELVPAGWTFSRVSCIYENQSVGNEITNGERITVDNGDSVTCTFTNTRQTGSLRIIKVVQGRGETATSSSFQIHVKQNTTEIAGSPQAGNSEGTTYNNLPTGTYTVSETEGPTGFAATFSGACDTNGSVIVINSETPVTCTITNTKAGILIIKKVVVNDNGGTKTAVDFSFQINQGPATTFEADGQNEVSLANGTYAVTEPTVVGYTTTYENCNNIELSVGQEKTCTITNNDIQPKLTVIKVVINNNGQTKTVADFSLFASETAVTSGAQNGFNAGIYKVQETADSLYVSTTSGDCLADGSITLAPGDVKFCIITNDDVILQHGSGSTGQVVPSNTSGGTGGTLNKPGDVNGDGGVDQNDLLVLLADWGRAGVSTSDLNGDGAVNELDLAILMFNWGK